MCEFCDEGQMLSCDDCGKLICFDRKYGDDVIGAGFVTSSGNPICGTCARHWHESEEQDEHGYAW